MILEGTTSSGAVVPVQVTDQGRVVAEGLQGPQGPEGPEGQQGPEGPPGPAGGYWERTGTVVSPTNAGDSLELTSGGAAGVSLNPGTTASPLVRTSTGIVYIGNAYSSSAVANGISCGPTGQIYLTGAGGDAIRVHDSTGGGSGTIAHQLFHDGRAELGKKAVNIDNAGRLLVGTATGTSFTTAVFKGNSNSATGNAVLRVCAGSDALAVNNVLGGVYFAGANQSTAAAVSAEVDGTWTAGTAHPGRLVFTTTPDGSATPVERMRIDSQGDVVFQGAPIIRSPNGTHWAIEVDNNGNLSAIQAI